jgi:hypothetical protein
VEFAGLLYRDDRTGFYYYTAAAIGTASTSNPYRTSKQCPSGVTIVGDYHTHAAFHKDTDEIFSPQDLALTQAYGSSSFGYRSYISYLATPHGRIGYYDGINDPAYTGSDPVIGVP